MRKGIKRLIAVLSLAAFLMVLSPQAALANDAGYAVGSGVASLFYTPLKLAVCLLSGITGGLSLVGTAPAGRPDISYRIVKWGAYGDWVIQPKHLKGEATPKMIATDATDTTG